MASLSVHWMPIIAGSSQFPSGVASPVSAVELTVKVVAHAGLAVRVAANSSARARASVNLAGILSFPVTAFVVS